MIIKMRGLLPILAVLVFTSAVLGQDINNAVKMFNQKKIEEIRQALPELELKYGARPEIIFLKGVLEEDAEVAYRYYREIVENHNDLDLSQEALWRIGQYNYAKGLYEAAGVFFKKIIEKDPRSELAEKAKRYLVILEMQFGEQMSNPEKANIGRPRFVLQFGAFANLRNAERLANYFKEKRYTDVEINRKRIAGTMLYRVWVGEYSSREEAKEEGDKIRSQYRIPYRIEEKQ